MLAGCAEEKPSTSRANSGCEPDPQEAFTWFVKAGEGGDEEGMYKAAEMLYEGEHVPQDLERAYSWYLKAAEVGHKTAMMKVSHEYRRGRYLPLDPKQAEFWYERAVAKGWKPRKTQRTAE